MCTAFGVHFFWPTLYMPMAQTNVGYRTDQDVVPTGVDLVARVRVWVMVRCVNDSHSSVNALVCAAVYRETMAYLDI